MNISNGPTVLSALQGLLDRTLTPDNVKRILESRHLIDSPGVLYWHPRRPPLASISFGPSTDRTHLGLHLTLLLRTYRQQGDPMLPEDFADRLLLRHVATGEVDLFANTYQGVCAAHLILPTPVWQADTRVVIE